MFRGTHAHRAYDRLALIPVPITAAIMVEYTLEEGDMLTMELLDVRGSIGQLWLVHERCAAGL